MNNNKIKGSGIDPHLLEIMKIQSVSRDETEIRKYIIRKLKTIKGVKIKTDLDGNIMVTKGLSDDYICLCCHQDTVHQIKDNFNVHHDTQKGELFATSYGERVGIGGDDKCGAFAILHLLQTTDKPIKAVFFSNEEIGCQGSYNIDIDFFEDVILLIGIDRRGDSDLITYYHWNTINDYFRNILIPIAINYGYTETNGLITDVFIIQQRLITISAINVSCGFYNPHTNFEYVKISALYKCIDFVKNIIETII